MKIVSEKTHAAIMFKHADWLKNANRNLALIFIENISKGSSLQG